MRKKIIILVTVIAVLLAGFTFAYGSDNNDPPWPADRVANFVWRDLEWEFNEDFTKVKIRENKEGEWKTYDNYVLIDRSGDKLGFYNTGLMYLLDGVLQGDYTPDEFFCSQSYNEGILKIVTNAIDGIWAYFPDTEIISINYEPWQNTIFKDYVINRFEFAEEDVQEFLTDAENNGYANEVFSKNKSILGAKRDLNIDELGIIVSSLDIYRSSKEADSDYKKTLSTDQDRYAVLVGISERKIYTPAEFKELIKTPDDSGGNL